MVLYNDGKTLQNKTFEYLTPLFRIYQPNFIDRLSKINVLAYGIADTHDVTNKQPSFYILININVLKAQVIYFLDFIKEQQCYIKHYNYDKSKIMVVISIPEKYYKSYYHFKRGHYSKMYNEEEIEMFFNNNYRQLTYNKLKKTETGLENYVSRVANEFDINISSHFISSLQQHPEYDMPISVNIKQEIFNKRK